MKKEEEGMILEGTEVILEVVVTILQILLCSLASVIAVGFIIVAVQITIAYSLEIAETYKKRKCLRNGM